MFLLCDSKNEKKDKTPSVILLKETAIKESEKRAGGERRGGVEKGARKVLRIITEGKYM